MTVYVALLRGVNLVGNSTLKMADLKEIAGELGLASARTYIASGNLLFSAATSLRRSSRQMLREAPCRSIWVKVSA